MRTEVYRDSALVEWFGVDGADWVHVRGGAEVERRPATPEELAADLPATPAVDIVTLANNLAALTEAVDFLILDSLGGL